MAQTHPHCLITIAASHPATCSIPPPLCSVRGAQGWLLRQLAASPEKGREGLAEAAGIDAALP